MFEKDGKGKEKKKLLASICFQTSSLHRSLNRRRNEARLGKKRLRLTILRRSRQEIREDLKELMDFLKEEGDDKSAIVEASLAYKNFLKSDKPVKELFVLELVEFGLEFGLEFGSEFGLEFGSTILFQTLHNPYKFSYFFRVHKFQTLNNPYNL